MEENLKSIGARREMNHDYGILWFATVSILLLLKDFLEGFVKSFWFSF